MAAAEYFLVLGAKHAGLSLEAGQSLKPSVLEYFPPAFAETSFIRDLPLFCFPGGLTARLDEQDPRFYTMALTDDRGRLYAHCFYFDVEVQDKRTEAPVSASSPLPGGRIALSKSTTKAMVDLPPLEIERKFYITRSLCILSRAPLFNTFKSYLSFLHRCILQGSAPQPLEVYISHLILHSPLPPSGLAFALPAFGERLLITSPPLPRFSLYDLSIIPLFHALDFSNLSTLLAAVLTERKVLFFSSSYTLLSLAAQAVTGLIWPLQYPFTYIPIVPSSLIECVEAPTPYLMGLHSSAVQNLPDLSDVLIVDLDNNKLTVPAEAPPPLPATPLEKLRRAVWTHVHEELMRLDFVSTSSVSSHTPAARLLQQTHIQSAFLRFVFEIYSALLSRIDPTRTILEPSEYLRQLPDVASDAFLSQFVESQAFRALLLETEKYRALNEHDIQAFCREFSAPSPRVLALAIHEATSLSASGNLPPKSPTPVRRVEWPRGTFPELKAENFLPSRKDLILSEISAMCASERSSAPLHLFRASLHASATKNPDWNALFADIEHAVTLEGVNYSIVDLTSTLLAQLTSQVLSSVRLCGPFVNSAVARHIKSLQLAEAREDLTLSADLMTLSRDDSSGMILGEDDLRIAKNTFATFLYRAGLTPDERVALLVFEALSRLGPKKQTIRSAKVRLFLNALRDVSSIASPIDLATNESLFYIADMQLLPTATKGRLLLTKKRLIFTAKLHNKVLAEVSYENIKSVEEFQLRPVIFGATVPTLQLALFNSATPLSLLLPPDRSLVFHYLREIIPAAQIAAEISDERFLRTSLNRVRLCEAVRRVERRAHIKPLLGDTPHLNDPWVKKIKEAEKLGILNLDRILTGLVSPRVRKDIHPLQLSVHVLEVILDLFYAYMKHDGGTIDWDGLAHCDDLDSYHSLISSLSKVDLRQYSDSERLAFFVNVYNSLLLHAYVIHAGYPASYLEWRFVTKSAHYSIGGSAYSLDDILHGILRGNKPLAHFSHGERFGHNDPRREVTLKRTDPRIHFLLCYHLASSPGAVVVRPDASADTLKKAAEDYIRDHVSIVNNKDVKLPCLFQWYRSDFGQTKEELVDFLAPFIPAINDLRVSLLDGTSSFIFYYDWRGAPKPLRATAARAAASPHSFNLYSSSSHVSVDRITTVSSPGTVRRLSAFQLAMNDAAKELDEMK